MIERLAILFEIFVIATILVVVSSRRKVIAENFLVRPSNVEQAIIGIVALSTMLEGNLECKISNVEWDPNLIDTSELPLIHYRMSKFSQIPELKLDDPFKEMSPYGVYKFCLENNIHVSPEKVAKDMIAAANAIKFREHMFQGFLPQGVNLQECYCIHVSLTGDNYTPRQLSDKLLANIKKLTSKTSTFKCLVIAENEKNTKSFINALKLVTKNIYRETHIETETYSIDFEALPDKLIHDYPDFKTHFMLYCMMKCLAIVQIVEPSDLSLLAAFMSQKPLHTYENNDALTLWKPCIRLVADGVEHDHVIDTVELEGTFSRIFSK